MKAESLRQLRELREHMNNTLGCGNAGSEALLREAVRTIENVTRLETTVRGRFNLMSYASRDGLRPQMRGIYHAGGFRYSTDSHVVVKIREEYPEEYECKLLMRDGSLRWCDGKTHEDGMPILKYPNVDSVLRPSNTAHAFPMNDTLWSLVREHYRSFLAARKLADREDKPVVYARYYVCLDGSWFNLNILLPFLRAARHMGATELQLDGRNAALAFCGERGAAAAMPILPPVDERGGEYYLYIDRETLAEKETAQALEK